MKRRKRDGNSARRGNLAVQNLGKPKKVIWQIYERDGAFVADSGTGVIVWADSVEKLQAWVSA